MAAKRLAQSTFNWAALAERVPEGQNAQYLAFKSKADAYARRMMATPQTPPPIDWQYYVNTVPVPGLVQEFKQKYDAVQIPVPAADEFYKELDKQEKAYDQEIASFKAESEKRIAECQSELARLHASIPFHMMTYEELYIHAPECGIDRKNPGFYPHQLDQKDMAEPPEH